MSKKKLEEGKVGEDEEVFDDSSTGEFDVSEAKTIPIIPVAPRLRSELTTSRVPTLTGVLLASSADDILDEVLDDMVVDGAEAVNLLQRLEDWGGPRFDISLVYREAPDLLKKLKIIASMQACIPGSALLIEIFFADNLEVLREPQLKIGLGLKVDLSEFTSRLREMQFTEGDASGLSPLINSDLDKIAEICTQAGLKLVSLGGDAATFVYFGEDADSKGEALSKSIAALSRCHTNEEALGRGARFLHHDFKVVAVYGPIEIFPVEIGDNKILRVGGDAVSNIDLYEKKLRPGGSTMEYVPGYEPGHGLRELMVAHRLIGVEGLSEEPLSAAEVSLCLDDLIRDLDTYLRPDISLKQVAEANFYDSKRDYSTIMISMKGLRSAGGNENDYIVEVSRQARLYGGLIYKVEGDVIIVLFPKQISGDSFVRRAYEFANNCLSLNDVCRYAMTTGELLESLLGPQGNQELGVLGIAVNRAARILSISTPEAVGLDEPSYLSLESGLGQVLTDEVKTDFKGLEATRVVRARGYNDVSAKPVSAMINASQWPSIVGRVKELESFSSFFTQHLGSSSSEVVYVSGESGVGKNAFLSNALAKSGVALYGPFVEHESDLFQRPYSACVGLTRSIIDSAGGAAFLAEIELQDSSRDLIESLYGGNFSELSGDESLARALVELLNVWAGVMIDRGSTPPPRATLLLGKINFWDPPSIKIVSMVYDYFRSTGDLKLLFIFTENSGVADTRDEERRGHLDKFKADATGANGLYLHLFPLNKEQTRDLILDVARKWEPTRRAVHARVVDFIFSHSKGIPARIKTLTGMVYAPEREYAGVTPFRRIEILERSGALNTSAGLSLSYIDYMGFENPGQVKSFVQIFALFGNAFSFHFLARIAADYISPVFAAELDYVIGVLVSRSILRIDGETVSFKHSGQRADFRKSVPTAEKKKYLMRAIDDFTDLDGEVGVQISKFHWLKELIEIWNGDGDDRKRLYVGRLVKSAEMVVSNLGAQAGNQLSVIYYTDTVLAKLTDGGVGDEDLGAAFASLEEVLRQVYPPEVVADFSKLALSSGDAYLGTGSLRNAHISEHMLGVVRNLSHDPETIVRSMVGVIRAQIWGVRAEKGRNRALVDSSMNLREYKGVLADSGVELDDDLDNEAHLVSETLICAIELIHAKKPNSADLDVAISTLKSLIRENIVYLNGRNVPLHLWMQALLARLYVKRGFDSSTDIAVKRECFGSAMEESTELIARVLDFPDKARLVKLFPNVIDVFIIARMAASYFVVCCKKDPEAVGEMKDMWESEIASAEAFLLRAINDGCNFAQSIGVQKSYVQALESKVVYHLQRGNLSQVDSATAEIVTVVEMIGDRPSLASNQFIRLMLKFSELSGVDFCGALSFVGRSERAVCEAQLAGLDADVKLEMWCAVNAFSSQYKESILDDDVLDNLEWVEGLLPSEEFVS